MARTLTAPSAVEVVEEAIHLLRASALRSLALAWTAAVPFAIGLLLFWRDMAHHRGGNTLCALESLLLVALLLWMNVRRGIFAVTLTARLSGAEPRLADASTCRAIGVQLLTGNFKLLALPLAALTLLPFPRSVALFRIAGGIAAAENKSFFETIAKARKLTSSIAQPALLTILLGFIALLLFANIFVALALAPRVVLALTGYESLFTRAGVRILADPSFYLVAGVIVWLAMEPLVQAVYAVAAFHAESIETGEDVRVRFRALLRIGGAAAALLLILTTSPLAAGTRVDPSNLDRSIRQTMASPEYSWHVRPETKESDSWFVRFTDSLAESLSGVIDAINRGVAFIVHWFRGLFETPPARRQGPPASGEIRMGLYAASILALLAASYLIWRGRSAFTRTSASLEMPAQPINLAAEDLAADQLPEEHWYLLADECLRSARFRLGLRALHLATLAWLGRERWIAIHPGKTDHEYESELKRRARLFPDACLQFSSNVDVFERIWYGDREASLDTCRAFRDRSDELKRRMSAPGISL